MIQHSKLADEIAALYGLSLTGKGFTMRHEQEWQFIREQVYARIPYISVREWLDNEVLPHVKFDGGAE